MAVVVNINSILVLKQSPPSGTGEMTGLVVRHTAWPYLFVWVKIELGECLVELGSQRLMRLLIPLGRRKGIGAIRLDDELILQFVRQRNIRRVVRLQYLNADDKKQILGIRRKLVDARCIDNIWGVVWSLSTISIEA